MSPEKQRIAIAEACGLRQLGYMPSAITCGATLVHVGEGMAPQAVPDYLNDLNAMNEAEGNLDRQQQATFALLLHQNSNRVMADHLGRDFDCIHSSASQRAEAFLLTIGKWEDDK